MSATSYEMRSRRGDCLCAFDNRERALSAMMAHGAPCEIVRVARIEVPVANTFAASSVPPQKAQPTLRAEAVQGVKGRAS